MTDRPYTDADLRAEAARQLRRQALAVRPDTVLRHMLDASVESTRCDGDALTWDEALECRDLNGVAQQVAGLIDGAADVSEWAINLGADGLTPSTEHAITINGDHRPLARVHFAFSPDVPEEVRTALVEDFGRALHDAGVEPDEAAAEQ